VLPRGLPTGPTGQLGNSDLAPIAPPQLHDGFATVGNCNCVSPPSGYTGASALAACAPVAHSVPVTPVLSATNAAPAPIASAPIAAPVLPLAAPPQTAGVPHGPLISFGQELNPVVVGQGLWGQPVAYVPGQKCRNCIRYLFP
jgi:hypothetical protein